MIPWRDIILGHRSPEDAWSMLFENVGELARNTASPVELHNKTIQPDRLLAEGAWDLWNGYPTAAHRTSDALRSWWAAPTGQGRAILILDALSLRELPVLLAAAAARNIHPTKVSVTGSEAPSESNTFAHALGLPSRGALSHSGYPMSFCFASDGPWTDVLAVPFEDCIPMIQPQRDVVLWHEWLDNLLHVHSNAPDQVYHAASLGLQGDGFWKLVDRLRTGRRLLITADHGYAASRLFATNENDPEVVDALRATFGASRCKPATQPWTRSLMPPVVFTHNGHHMVMGQRKWTVQGGFPYLCHGGLTLLEVAVPFLEFPSL